MAKITAKIKRLRKIEKILGGNWDRHIEKVRPLIKEHDNKNADSLAKAPQIAVSNATK